MSEVKPTLVSVRDEGSEQILPNSWRSNFPNARWSDANNRGYLWVMYNRSAIFNVKSYEFRVKFNEPVSNFFISFPIVVKTLNEGVHETFINSTKYNKRSKINYGTGFTISGSEFHFKVATRYKLSGRVYPIVYVYYNNATFNNLNRLNIVGFRTNIELKPVFTNRNILYNAVIYINPTFINVNRLIYKGSVAISTRFINVNNLITSLANCQNTTWERFGEVWSGCRIWMPSVPVSVFTNRNNLITSFPNCENTTWDRFGEMWIGCEFWVPLTPPSGAFINVNDLKTDIVNTRTSSGEFININNITVEDIRTVDACSDTTWDRFGGIWEGCERWMPLTPPSGAFINVNDLITSLATCSDTTWDRFGGIWEGCEIWTL
jgi:hypothetical protein